MSKLKIDDKQSPATEQIAIAKLEKSPLNARKTTSKAACEELKASILAHGLLQNLVVTEGKKGKYRGMVKSCVRGFFRRRASP